MAVVTPFVDPAASIPDEGSASFTGDRLDIRQIPDPTTPLTITLLNVPGNVDNDDYTYAVDFQTNSDNFTLHTPDSNMVSVVDNAVAGQIHITGIPQPTDPSVFAINLYRNGANLLGGYSKVVQLPVGTTSYTDNLADASIPQDAPSQVNTTGKLYVDGDTQLQKLSATSALIGTEGLEENTIDETGANFQHLGVSPKTQTEGLLIAPVGDGAGTYTGDLFVMYGGIVTHQILGTAKFDQNGSLVSGVLTNYAQNVIDGNIHVKALQPSRTYALKVDTAIPVFFGGRILAASTSATAAGNLTLGAANQNMIAGSTTISYIDKTGWTAGSRVSLVFAGTPTITHNGGSPTGNFAPILLSTSINFTMTGAGNTLTLELDANGKWQEMGRKVA